MMLLSTGLPEPVSVYMPEAGVGLLTVWVLWQVYAPKFGVPTRLAPLFELPERVERTEQRIEETSEKFDNINQRQAHHIQVSRANARALDPDKQVTINSNEVDRYLIDNGIAVSELTKRVNETDTDE